MGCKPSYSKYFLLDFQTGFAKCREFHLFRYQLVMPMHDAALYIVDNLDKACKDDIEKQFKMAFKHYLPNITPIVKFKNYFEGE